MNRNEQIESNQEYLKGLSILERDFFIGIDKPIILCDCIFKYYSKYDNDNADISQ